MQTSIELEFGDGQYVFRLGLQQITLIEDACSAGIGEIYSRIMKGRYLVEGASIGVTQDARFRVSDLIEVIRQGLIGGGQGTVDGQPVTVNTLKANSLIQGYVVGRPLAEAWTLASIILTTLMQGYEPKKVEPGVDPAAGGKTTTGA